MTKIKDLLIINLKRARTRMGLSQMLLAERTGLSLGFIGDIEAGKKFPSDATLQKMVDALGLRPYELFIDDGDTEIPHRHEMLYTAKEELIRSIEGHIDAVFDKHLSNV